MSNIKNYNFTDRYLNSDSRSLLAFLLYYSTFIFLILTAQSLMVRLVKLRHCTWWNWQIEKVFITSVPQIDSAVFGTIRFATSNWRFYKFYFIRLAHVQESRPNVSLCRHFVLLFSSKRVSKTRYLSSRWYIFRELFCVSLCYGQVTEFCPPMW